MVEELKNVDKIKNIINDIEHEFELNQNEIEKAVSQMKNDIKLQNFDFENKKTKSNKKYLSLKDKYNKLLDEKNFIINLINNDQEDLKIIENENMDLRGQIEKQEINNSDIKKALESKKNLVIDLKKKIDTLNKLNKTKEMKLLNKVLEYRKYLGINFQVVDGNKIKVLFDKLCRDESFECYVVLDFNDGYNIVEIYPKIMSIERYSLCLKDKTKFFDLIKEIRKEFVKEYCK
ncbi:kinetochore protein (Spc25) [Vairimorpha necatrix]|uniref:Kinetochore protein SPC25 n=1 Tax=Vairimorpha necatrix TaxID=6039 RepID=A0AAX4J8N5_9MICR